STGRLRSRRSLGSDPEDLLLLRLELLFTDDPLCLQLSELLELAHVVGLGRFGWGRTRRLLSLELRDPCFLLSLLLLRGRLVRSPFGALVACPADDHRRPDQSGTSASKHFQSPLYALACSSAHSRAA